LDFRNGWDPFWLGGYAATRVDERTRRDEELDIPLPSEHFGGVGIDPPKCRSPRITNAIKVAGRRVNVKFKDPSWLIEGVDSSHVVGPGVHPSYESDRVVWYARDTLAEFRRGWDSLRNLRVASNPLLLEEATATADDLNGQRHSAWQAVNPSAEYAE